MYKNFYINKTTQMINTSYFYTTSSPNTTILSNTNDNNSLIVTILTYVDSINRITANLVFVIYFLMIVIIKELRTCHLLYTHHTNLVGFLFCLMYLFYFNSSQPNFNDQLLDHILCEISEIVWAMLFYLRSYSVLIIAIHRFTAVFFIDFYKKINNSVIYMILPILSIWFFSLIMVVGTKFGFNTTYGSFYCIYGYSDNLKNVTYYLITSTVIGIFLPFLLITVIYFEIRKKLSIIQKEKKTVKNEESSSKHTITIDLFSFNIGYSLRGSNINSLRIKKKVDLNRNKQFNQQLILINICCIMCFIMTFILSFRYIIPNFNDYYYPYRQALRILNVFFQSLIPVVTLYFNSGIRNKLTAA